MLIILCAVQCEEKRNFLRNRFSAVSFNVLGGKRYIHIHVFCIIFHLFYRTSTAFCAWIYYWLRKEGDLEESCSSCSPKMKNRTLQNSRKVWIKRQFYSQKCWVTFSFSSKFKYFKTDTVLTISWHAVRQSCSLLPHFCRTNSFLLCFRLNAPCLSKYFWTKL